MNSTATTLLAERPLLGYPDTTIELHVIDRTMRVFISDPVGLTEWAPVTKFEAKEMYFHPFVYGYNAPNLSTYEEDGA